MNNAKAILDFHWAATSDVRCLVLMVLVLGLFSNQSAAQDQSYYVNELREKLKSQEPFDRLKAVESLGNLGKNARSAVPDLSAALQDNDVEVREYAGRALSNIGKEAKEAVIALSAALQDADNEVCMIAVRGLGRIGKEAKEAVPALIAALRHHRDSGVRAGAADALGQMGQEAKNAVPALKEALKDQGPLVGYSAAEALGLIGKEAKEAVPVLIVALQEDDPSVRGGAAAALGLINHEAKDAVPALIKVIKDTDEDVRSRAAEALCLIADGLYDTRSTEMLSQLKLAYEAMKEDQGRGVSYKAVRIKRVIDFFEAIKGPSPSYFQRFIREHYIVAGFVAVYLLIQCFWALCFGLWPLLLLQTHTKLDRLGSYKIDKFEKSISVSLLLIFPLLRYHPRLLDAWVSKYLDAAKTSFTANLTVKQHKVYVPTPAILNEQLCDSLTAAQLQPIFEKSKATVLLAGEGGAGKTSLACQTGFWAMEEKPEQRLCKAHPMIPVLIEGNLKARDDKKNPFFIALRKSLSDLTGDTEPLLDELANQLLKKSRVLVIVDSFSELDEATQNSIRQAQDDFLVGALIVTTRNKEEALGGTAKTIINPPRLKGKVLTSFLQNYLCQRLERELSEQEDLELFSGCKRLSEIIGEREITVLIAKMYAEQMLAAKLKLEAEDQPRNLPDLMKSYVKTLNDKVKLNPLDTYKVLRAAKLIAWECLRHKLHPSFAKKEDVLTALKDEANAEALLDYLEDSVPLVQTKGVGADQLKFFLDPLAEYLAAFYLMERFPDNKLWSDFLTRADDDATGASRSFIAAVLDCCTELRDEYPVPERYLTDLQQLCSSNVAATETITSS